MTNLNISKSWFITILPLIIGLSMIVEDHITGKDLSPIEVQILDNFILPSFLGSGSIGAAKAGHEIYVQYKAGNLSQPDQTPQRPPQAPQTPQTPQTTSDQSSQTLTAD